MDAEIIAVGSELLLGQIVNTNGRFLSHNLLKWELMFIIILLLAIMIVRLKQAIEIAESRAKFNCFYRWPRTNKR